MQRTAEPELMNDREQAAAYAAADFSESNTLFVQSFRTGFPDLEPANILDLGCGPGDIPLRLAHAYPGARITAIDGAPAMLELARQKARQAGAGERVRFELAYLGHHSLARWGPTQAVVSNSLLHHLADPLDLWRGINEAGGPGCAVLVMDLRRPASREVAEALVERYASQEPEVLRTDFFNSLLAAYEPEEVEQQLAAAGLRGLAVSCPSDRHLLVAGCLSP
ncbi:MAG: class I SAM-dependent methyltransferase [Gammaproteobacteria bacterium]|nr:class I SAM-dependent methyltransferase [Gammaproteobacteria bacterium]